MADFLIVGRRITRLFIATSLLAMAGCTKKTSTDAAAADGKEGKGAKSGAVAESGGGKSGGKGSGKGGRGGGSGQKQPVEVVTLARRDLSETLRVVGSLAANETATIRPEMSGLIKAIHFEEGQRVKKGDLLVKIDDSELRAQLAQTQSRHQLAKLNLERAENLRQTQSNTQADADRARSEFTAAVAELELLQVRINRTEVRAPFDGVVEARTLSSGDYVNTQAIITTINDLSKLKVEFQVPERYLAKVRRGTKFTVKPSSAEEVAGAVEGEVYFVNSVIDRNTRSSEVKGFLTQPSPLVKAGMFAVIEIVLEVRKGVTTVPEGAIYVDQRGPQVVSVVTRGGETVAEFVPVKLGLRAKGMVEIKPVKGEFDEKLQVVAAGVGSLALFDGAKLEPRPLRAEFMIND